jgi:hypothetical protein
MCPVRLRSCGAWDHTRRVRPEEAADPKREVFVPVPAEGEEYENSLTAEAAALELMASDGWEVGVLVVAVGGPFPWRLEWLEPASPFQRREVVNEELRGYEWVRAAPPRRDEGQAIHELRHAWTKDQGRRGYAIERQVLSGADLTRILLEFRERAVY